MEWKCQHEFVQCGSGMEVCRYCSFVRGADSRNDIAKPGCPDCADLRAELQSVLSERDALLAGVVQREAEVERLRADVRTAVADYMRSEGCACCQNIEDHKDHKERLAELLDVPKYEDGSGCDFGRYETGKKSAARRGEVEANV